MHFLQANLLGWLRLLATDLTLGDFHKQIYPLAGRMKMSHLGNSEFRSSLLSISRMAVLVSEIPFE